MCYVSNEWKTYKFDIQALKKGKIDFHIGGLWAAKKEDQQQVLISQIKVNGKLMKNGDFKYTFPHAGKTYPKEFWLHKGAEYLPKGGPDGKPAVKVFFDNPLIFVYRFKANKVYSFEITAKAFEK